MSEATEFTIGSEVSCRDGVCGELTRVIVDPVAQALTHLVVEPRHRPGSGRLVPLGLVESAAAAIRLRCSMAEFEALEEAQETEFLPGASGEWSYGQGQMLSLPFFALGSAATGGMGLDGVGMAGLSDGPHVIVHDRVPVGEVDVRRGEHVHATDGAIGRVRGLVIDPADRHVTHFLLEEGHLWGQKEVAIPIAAVQDVTDGVRLNLTQDQVRDLPAVDIDHPG